MGIPKCPVVLTSLFEHNETASDLNFRKFPKQKKILEIQYRLCYNKLECSTNTCAAILYLEGTMLNTDKVRLMTRLAVYETKVGKEDIRLSKYYKTDYVRYQVIKSIIGATFGYALILLLIFIYQSEYIIKNAVTLDYKVIGTYVLGIYIIVVALYGLGASVGYSIKYDLSRKKLSRYYKLLKRLSRIYNEETPEV